MESFEEIVGVLNRMLGQHDRPASVVWIDADDICVVFGRTFVRAILPDNGLAHARTTFTTRTTRTK